MTQKNQVFLFLGLAIVALVSRWIPHPPNFSPLIAIALFGGTVLSSKKLAFMLPILAIFLSDLVLGFYPMFLGVYFCLALVVAVGLAMKSLFKDSKLNKVASLLSGSIVASIVFYLTSNLFVWASSGMYPMTGTGLIESYVMAIPFFNNSLASTIVYAAALFTAYEWASRRIAAGAAA